MFFSGMLYMIGLGLNDEKDITINALEAVQSCDYVYLESYTSKLLVSKEKLETFYGKKIIDAPRNLVEQGSDEILLKAKDHNVAFLVVGDPFGATTHADLFLRVKELDIDVRIYHNASILNAIGEVGLELYKFGKTTSVTFPEKSFRPQTCYDVIKQNMCNGLHTLCLLDIKADLDKFMSVNYALEYLFDIEKERNENVFTKETLCVGLARIGSKNSQIISGTCEELLTKDFGEPLHCLIVPAKLHFIEEDMINYWKK